jgi:methyl coenzyme M reductase beta subunit
MKDQETIILKQYQAPSKWYEYGAYAGAVGLFAATVANPGVMLWPGAITAILLYWNYLMFDIIKKYVNYVNAQQISKLLTDLAENHSSGKEDGTFQSNDGLITGEDTVNEEEEEG